MANPILVTGSAGPVGSSSMIPAHASPVLTTGDSTLQPLNERATFR